MRHRFSSAKVRWLPFLHVRRILGAGLKMLAHAPRAIRNFDLPLMLGSWRQLWALWLRMQRSAPMVQATAMDPQHGRRQDLQRALRLTRAVNRAARYMFVPSTCLSRSLVLKSLLAREGLDGDVRIGVRAATSGIEAHAWVEHAGTPINDRHDIAAAFQPFDGALSPRAFLGP